MPETTTFAPEIWTRDGVPFELHAVDMAAREAEFLASLSDEEAAMWEPWYPDFPGERPPQTYQLTRVGNPYDVVAEFTVFPVGGWSWYDAASDRLLRDGYDPPPPTEADLAVCEHGLSARLCSGPNHYGEDDGDRF